MKVSEIVPTYNHEHFIGRCLESIVTQSLDEPFEIIVLNDASTDNTEAEIRKYADKYSDLIQAVLCRTNSCDYGVSNVHSAFKSSKGRYICVIDGDDEALPGKLKKMADILDTHLECALVGHCVQVLDNDKLAPKILYSGSPSVADIGYYFSRGIVLQGMMFRRSAIPAEGFIFDPDHGANYDYIQQAQLAVRGRVGFIDEVLGLYRIQPGNYTTTRQGDVVTKMLNGRIRALDYLQVRRAISEHDFKLSLKEAFWEVCEEHLRKRSFAHFCDVVVRANEGKSVDIEANLNYKTKEIALTFKF